MKKTSFALMLCGMACAATAQAARPENGGAAPQEAHAAHGDMARPMAWTAYPMLKTRAAGESRERMVVYAVPQNVVSANIDAYLNNTKSGNMHRQLAVEMAGAKLDKPESGGFQWLAAREEQEGKVLVASTVYYFGERGAKNPTAMFMQQKHELEIIPQPYPREHSRYRANEDWQFLVRFNGQPLANQPVVMETQNGSHLDAVSDAAGRVRLHLPEDFKPVEESSAPAAGHMHGMRTADFVLATEYESGGKHYLTGFNSSYGPDAFDRRSLAMGLGFTLLGGLGAVPLLRQRKSGAPENKPQANEEV